MVVCTLGFVHDAQNPRELFFCCCWFATAPPTMMGVNESPCHTSSHNKKKTFLTNLQKLNGTRGERAASSVL